MDITYKLPYYYLPPSTYGMDHRQKHKKFNNYRQRRLKLVICFILLLVILECIGVNVISTPLSALCSKSRHWPTWPDKNLVRREDATLLNEIYKDQNRLAAPLFRIQNIPITDKIPRIIHQMWKTTSIPEDTKQWVEKWPRMNPNWTYMFWTDDSAKRFIKEYYPMLISTYELLAFPVQKSDLFRAVLMYSIGGVYADIDMEPLRSVEEIRAWSPCILPLEPEEHVHITFGRLDDSTNRTLLSNAFMACRPGHPFFFFFIGQIVHGMTIRNNAWRLHGATIKCTLEETLLCTGPVVLSKSAIFYKRSFSHNKNHKDDILISDSKYFLPTFASHALVRLKSICKGGFSRLDKIGQETCEKLKGNNFSNVVSNVSVTNHHWYDSYHQHGIKPEVNLNVFMNKVILFPEVEFDVVMRRRRNSYQHF